MKNLIQSKKQGIVVLMILFCLSITKTFATNPVITSFSPTSGPVGTTVALSGSNFNTTAANNIVFFGATRATVSSATASSLIVTVPTGATYQDISVTDITTEMTGNSNQPFITTFADSANFVPTSFAEKVDYATGDFPIGISIGDLDGDGKPDLAVANYNSNTLSIFINTSSPGNVSFATKLDYTTGSSPCSVTIGDMDGDGKPDLVVANLNSNTVSVFRNISIPGTISFATKVDYTTGNSPSGVSIGDIDGDGKPDLVVTNQNDNSISVLKNISTPGTVSFAAKIDYATGSSPSSVSVSDLDGDGKPDLAVTNIGSNTVSIFKNTSTTSTLSFAAKVDYTTGSSPISVSVGDLDGDGKPDLAVVNENDYSVSILKNNSITDTLSFANKVDYATGTLPFNISIGDMNGDGKPDLVVANGRDKTISVFENKSTPGVISLAAKIDYSIGGGPYSLLIGDLDGDGKPDIAVSNILSVISVLRNRVMPPPTITSFAPIYATSGDTVTIAGNNLSEPMAVSFDSLTAYSFNGISDTALTAVVGAGATGNITVVTPGGTATQTGFTYTLPPAPAISSFAPTSARPGETVTIDGTNLIGTTTVSFGDTTASSFSVISDTVITAFVSDGATGSINVTTPGGTATKAGFTLIPPTVINSFTPTSGAIGTMVSIKGTGFNPEAANNIVFFGATQATVSSATDSTLIVKVPAGATYRDISVTDITTELTSYSNQPFVTTFNGSSAFIPTSFADKVDNATGAGPSDISTSDLNGDGKSDLIVTNSDDNSVSVFINTGAPGTISFAPKIDYTVGSSPRSVAVCDLNGDGKPDMAVANLKSNTISVFINTSSSGKVSFAEKVDYTTGNAPYSISTGDLDGDGKPDMVVTNLLDNTISVLKNTSSSGTVSFAARTDYVTGRVPFSLSIDDLDGDGKPDIAVINQDDNSISVFKNVSTPGVISFSDKKDYATGSHPNSVSIGDLDGDGKPDLAVANYSDNTISVLRNTSTPGTISFASMVDYSTGAYPYSISIGDLDGDGKPDMAVANYNGSTVSVLKNTGSTGTLSFDAKVDYQAGPNPYNISIGDLDGDGKPDLAVINNSSNTVSVLRSRVMPPPTITSFTPISATIGDTVTITGTYLSEPLAVSFDTVVAASFTGVSDTTLTAVVGSGGTGDISVTTPGGTASLAGFHYLLPQTITFDSINAQTYGDPDFALNATASSSLDIKYTIIDTTMATITSDTVHIKGTGSCKVFADQAGDTTYAAAPQVSRVLTAYAKPVEITEVTAASKVYDGTTTAELTGGYISGILGTDNVTLLVGTGEFADKNTGIGKTVTASGYALAGPDSGKYIITLQPTGLIADISPASLTITSVAAENKVYDGTTAATLTGGSLEGIFGSDDVTIVDGTGTFTDKNAGNGKTVTATGYTLSGNDSGNYRLLAQPSGISADITPAPLTILGVTAESKVYDGNTDATLTGGSLEGIIGSDDVTLTDGTGSFVDKNVGTGKTVNASGYAISGTDAGNYWFQTQLFGLMADITPAPLTTTGINAEGKVYDGTVDATLTGGSLDGVIGSDDVTLTDGTGTFTDKNVGSGKTVTTTGYDLSGTDAGNYNLTTQPSGLAADITPAPLTIAADSGQTKTEGTADPQFTYSIIDGSLMSGDSITGALTREPGEAAGDYLIQIGTLSAGHNYSITFNAATFTITPLTAVPSVSEDIPNAYPNPTKGLVTLNVPDGRVTITNLNGTVLDETSLASNKTINLNGYAPGVYILILKTNGSVYKYKIIKQ